MRVSQSHWGNDTLTGAHGATTFTIRNRGWSDGLKKSLFGSRLFRNSSEFRRYLSSRWNRPAGLIVRQTYGIGSRSFRCRLCSSAALYLGRRKIFF